MMHPIGRTELWHAQLALLAAIVLQFTLTTHLRVGPRYLVAIIEIILFVAIWLSAPRRHIGADRLNKTISFLLIGIISITNTGALGLLIKALIQSPNIPGKTLLSGAFAIFLTNIIVFGLLFWEMDSPGLSGHHKQNKDAHFQFPQMQSRSEESWRPTFFDYLYVSLTNGTAFSPTDTMPLTHLAKALMSVQAIISLITVVLVTARAVNILG